MEDSENLFINIRIDLNTKRNAIISYCKNVLNNNKCKGLKLSAVGGSIGAMIDIVEPLKMIISGLYQVNRLTSVAYLPVDNNNNEVNNGEKRLYPKMEVKLTLEKPTVITEGFQEKLPEEERKKLLDVFIKQREKEILEKERKRLEKERLEKERTERERKEKERKERERKEREKEEKEKQKLLEELNDKYNIIKNDLHVPFSLDNDKYEKLYKSKNNKCMICLEVYKVGKQVLYYLVRIYFILFVL